jgi:hypothetical protein
MTKVVTKDVRMETDKMIGKIIYCTLQLRILSFLGCRCS